MEPNEFYVLAKELYNNKSAAGFRTAINRAYCYAYNVSVQLLEDMGFHIAESAGGYRDVVDRFSNTNIEEIQDASSKLNDLYGMRIKADYRLGDKKPEKPTIVLSWLVQADNIVNTLKKHCTGDKREQIKAAIKEWEGKFKSSHRK